MQLWLEFQRKSSKLAKSGQTEISGSENLNIRGTGGDWSPHPLNPLQSDCKSALPAGRIFEKKGKLYRPPSQNRSKRYGYGFNISEIELLDESDYKENIIARIEPNWDKKISSTHTFSYIKNLYIIDAKMRRKK